MKKNWIKVTDKLPDTEDDVLVYDAEGNYEFAWYSKIFKEWYANQCLKYEYKITHWQPLEKPE